MSIPDLLGFGSSPKPPVEYTVEEHLRWLEPLFSSDGEWTVVGHSIGCVLAARAATRWPGRVRLVVLFNAPTFVSPESRRERLSRHNLLTRASTWSPVAGRVICEASCLSRPLLTMLAPLWRRELPRDVIRDYFRHTWNSYESSFRHLVMERDFMADVAEVPVPLLVAQGFDDALADPPSAVRWPGSVEVETVAGADHASLVLPDGSGVAAVLRRVVAPRRITRNRPTPERDWRWQDLVAGMGSCPGDVSVLRRRSLTASILAIAALLRRGASDDWPEPLRARELRQRHDGTRRRLRCARLNGKKWGCFESGIARACRTSSSGTHPTAHICGRRVRAGHRSWTRPGRPAPDRMIFGAWSPIQPCQGQGGARCSRDLPDRPTATAALPALAGRWFTPHIAVAVQAIPGAGLAEA